MKFVITQEPAPLSGMIVLLYQKGKTNFLSLFLFFTRKSFLKIGFQGCRYWIRFRPNSADPIGSRYSTLVDLHRVQLCLCLVLKVILPFLSLICSDCVIHIMIYLLCFSPLAPLGEYIYIFALTLTSFFERKNSHNVWYWYPLCMMKCFKLDLDQQHWLTPKDR